MFSLEHRSQLKIKSKNLPIFFVNLVLNSCQDLPLCPGWPESKVPNLAMQYLYTHSKHSIAFDTGRIHNLKPVSVECTKAGGYPIWCKFDLDLCAFSDIGLQELWPLELWCTIAAVAWRQSSQHLSLALTGGAPSNVTFHFQGRNDVDCARNEKVRVVKWVGKAPRSITCKFTSDMAI